MLLVNAAERTTGWISVVEHLNRLGTITGRKAWRKTWIWVFGYPQNNYLFLVSTAAITKSKDKFVRKESKITQKKKKKEEGGGGGQGGLTNSKDSDA